MKIKYNYSGTTVAVSASQVERFTRCPRSWWLRYVARVPEVIKNQASFDFGTTVHEVIERWMETDENGVGPEMYPEGWDKLVDGLDSQLIKKLITKAIETGVLVRTPGRRIEAPIGEITPSGECLPYPVMPGVGLIGYRDITAPGRCEDHKTSTSTRYLKTPSGLLSDPQMLIYGAVDLIESYKEGREPGPVLLRHNQFVKDANNPRVQFTEVVAEPQVLMDYWDQVFEPTCKSMLQLKQGTRDPKKWAEIEGPREKDACKAFGGCPYAKICGKVTTTDEHTEQVSLQEGDTVLETPTPDPLATSNKMGGIFDRLKKRNGGAPTTPAEEAKPPVEEAKTVVEETKTTVEVPQTPRRRQSVVATEEATPEVTTEVTGEVATPSDKTKPPWAVFDCPACTGVGFDAKGDPCVVCDRIHVAAHPEDALPSSYFLIEVRDGGCISWVPKASVLAAIAEDPRNIQGISGPLIQDPSMGREGNPTVTTRQEATARGKRQRQAAAAAGDTTPPAKKEVEPPPVQTEAPPVESDPVKDCIEEVLQGQQDLPIVKVPVDVQPDTKRTSSLTGLGAAEGKRAQGFILVYGTLRRSNKPYVDLNLVFARYAQELADKLESESYYMLDAYRRRDLMAAAAAKIAATIPNNTIVLVRPDGPDLREFTSALEVFASTVISGN